MKFVDLVRHISATVINAFCDGLYRSMPIAFDDGAPQ